MTRNSFMCKSYLLCLLTMSFIYYLIVFRILLIQIQNILLYIYLKTRTYSFQLLLRNFHRSSRHVHRLFGVEWISDTSRYEDIKLDPSFPLFFFPLLLILRKTKKFVSPEIAHIVRKIIVRFIFVKEIELSKSFSIVSTFAVRILLFLILDLISFSTERSTPTRYIFSLSHYLFYIKFHLLFKHLNPHLQ